MCVCERERERERGRERQADRQTDRALSMRSPFVCEREREGGRERERSSVLKGLKRAIVNQTNVGTVSKATLGKLQ